MILRVIYFFVVLFVTTGSKFHQIQSEIDSNFVLYSHIAQLIPNLVNFHANTFFK